jgi:uncharacterized protein (UPF0335 family)
MTAEVVQKITKNDVNELIERIDATLYQQKLINQQIKEVFSLER